MASRANLYIDQGIDFLMDLDVFSDDNIAINIGGNTFAGSARKVYSSTKAFDFTTTLISNTPGQIEVNLSSNTSLLVEPGKYQYDILMTTPLQITTKLLEGLVFILPTMTNNG